MMNSKLNRFKVLALSSLIVASMGVAIANEPELPEPGYEMTAEEIAEEEAMRAFDTYLASVVDDRANVIDDIVADNQNYAEDNDWDIDQWSSEFKRGLEDAGDLTLARILMDGDTYDDVVTILSGGTVAPEGLAGTQEIGDTTADLVFTPVTPCRIFDTRFDTDGANYPIAGNPGGIRHYYVYGSASLLYPQGHNKGVNSGSGCVSPGGEPSAIAANFTVAKTLANGHIRAWPYGYTQPVASFLNYVAGSNLANAGIVATRRYSSYDMSVSTWFGLAHSLADVMGYYYPVNGNEIEEQHNFTGSTASSTIASCQTLAYLYIYVYEPGYATVHADATYFHYKTLDGYAYINQYLQHASESACSTNNYNRVWRTLPYYETRALGNYDYVTLSQFRKIYMTASGYVYLRAAKTGTTSYLSKQSHHMMSDFSPNIPY